jgi:hypothetical protein
MDLAYSTREIKEEYIQILCTKFRRKDKFQDVGVFGITEMRRILKIRMRRMEWILLAQNRDTWQLL